jgi:hypothetical protein
MIFSGRFANEPPEQLIPVMVHESLHGGGTNSRQEEVIANILDSVCYAEVVLADPRVASFGTELAIFNNVELLALLNSMGRGGGGAVGISSSSLGDIFVGPGLEDFDAESIQAAILSDSFYGALPAIGSPGQATFTALMGRFPDAARLGDQPRFGDAALAGIVAGVGGVITARRAMRLATLLGLDMTGPVTEGPAPGPPPDSMQDRPFVPINPDLFSPRAALPSGKPMTAAAARAALNETLADMNLGRTARRQVLDRFDDAAVGRRVPDPALRAAALLLSAGTAWQPSAAAILDGDNPEGQPLSVEFADLPGSTRVAVTNGRASARGDPAILVNSWLQGEPLPVLASYLVEGSLLHDGRPAEDETIAAALLGTLAYADFLLLAPTAATASTWGAIQRNRDLLALVNSVPSRGAVANADSVGFLRPSNDAADILPGLYDDAGSFAEFVRARPSTPKLDQGDLRAPPAFGGYLDRAGIAPASGTGRIVFDRATLDALDGRLGAFLTPKDGLRVAAALDLGAA